jgi:8-oxo-dGTP diphosphatase
MSNHHFTEEENKAWLASLPKKSVAVKVIIKSNSNNILLVNPIYKKGWQLPGGGVEPNEEPKEAAVRELTEELGLDIDATKLKLIDSVFRREHDNLILIYEYVARINESEMFTPEPKELEGYKFETMDKVAAQISGYYGDFWDTYNT